MVAKGRSDLVRTKPAIEKKIKPVKKAQQELGCSDESTDSSTDKSNVDVQNINKLHISTSPDLPSNKAPSIKINESNRQSTSENEESKTESMPRNDEGKQSKTIISSIKRLFKFQLHFVNDIRCIEFIHLITLYQSLSLQHLVCYISRI